MSAPLSENPPRGIALFDLDGTLLPWDCQLLFRHFVLRREPWRGLFLPVFLMFLPLTKLLGDGGMKRIFLCYLWNMTPETLTVYAREFAISVMPAVYPEIRAMLEQHQHNGDFTILASASPEIYVAEIGRELGFDLTLGTQVDFTSFFPDLENHKGAAKVVSLRAVLPSAWFENGTLRTCHGYTDSQADLPMLALCDTATVVNPSPALAKKAHAAGWQIVRPTRPWKSRFGFAIRVLALLTGISEDPGALRKSGSKMRKLNHGGQDRCR